MKVGLLYDLRNPPQWHRPFPDLYAETLEHIVAVEALGFDAVMFTEHHFDPDGYLPSLLPMMAAAAARTRLVTIGTDVFLAPFVHPVRFAEDCAVVDILSNGRLILQAGEAYRPQEFEALGVEKRHRGSLTEETLDIIRRCWTEDTFDHEGRHYRLKGVHVSPKPVQQPHPPLYFAADTGRPLERAVRMGFHAATAHGVTSGPEPSEWKRWHDGWTDKLREFGRDPREFKCSTILNLFAAEDPEKAWEEHKEGILHVLNSYSVEGGDPTPPLETPEAIPNWRKIFQTPSDCVKYINEVYGSAPPDYVLLWGTRPGMSYNKSLEYHRLFAQQVLPGIRGLT